MRYLISYDLNRPRQNYDELYTALTNLGAIRVLKSQWTVDHGDTSCEQLFNHLWGFMDSTDDLLVCALADVCANERVGARINTA